MQYKIFSIPIIGGNKENEELNSFLRGHRVADVSKEIISINNTYYWSFCISYILEPERLPNATKKDAKEKTDYKELLDEKTFSRFIVMRRARKILADSHGFAAYNILTDAEMAEVAKLEPLSPQTMLSIPGIGKKKVEKYANDFIALTKEELEKELINEENGKPI